MKNDKGRFTASIQYGDSSIDSNWDEPRTLVRMRSVKATSGATWLLRFQI